MKHLYLILLVSLYLIQVGNGQVSYHSFPPGEIIEVPCVFDENVQISKYENYEIYQTVDDQELGQKLEQCISIVNGEIDLTNVILGKSLFIKYDNGSIDLFPNQIYNLNLPAFSDLFIPFDEVNCGQDLCNGFRLNMLHADTLSGESFRRVTEFPQSSFDHSYSTCIPTEKTAINSIESFVFRFELSEDLESFPIDIRVLYLEMQYWSTIIGQEETAPETYWDGTEYNINLDDLYGPYQSLLVLNHNEGIPSSDNVSLTVFEPEINSSEPKPIKLTIDQSGLYFQSHTQLAGGFRMNNDSLRHPLIIEDLNNSMCLYLIELIIEEETELRLGSGMHFNDNKACLQIRNGGSLTLMSDRIHQYGNQGVGMLYLRNNSSLNLERGAHLYFDGHLILSEEDYHFSDKIEVDLIPGTQLTFTENVTINSKDGSKLYVNMLGGQIDLAALPDNERQHIVLVYPEESEQELQQFSLFPNPSNGLMYLNSETGELIKEIDIYDSSGRLVHTNQGQTSLVIDVSFLQSGFYIAEITGNKSNTRLTFMVRH